MLEINYVKKDEVQSFNAGANMKLSIIVDELDTSDFSEPTIEYIRSMYNNTQNHITLSRMKATTQQVLGNIQEGNNDVLGTVNELLNNIAVFDIQFYFDIIAAIGGIIDSIDNNDSVAYGNRFKLALEEEMYKRNKEASDNASDEPTPEVESGNKVREDVTVNTDDIDVNTGYDGKY